MGSAPSFQIVVKRSVLKDLRRIPGIALTRIRDHIARLALIPIPPGAEPMAGYPGFFRIRVGPYRVVYEVAQEIRIITVIRIGHRREVYRNL